MSNVTRSLPLIILFLIQVNKGLFGSHSTNICFRNYFYKDPVWWNSNCIHLEEKKNWRPFHFSQVFHKESTFLIILLKNKKNQACYYALELHFNSSSAVFGSANMEFNFTLHNEAR